MSLANLLKEIARGGGDARDLASDDAQQLFAAMLDGGVPELELGAALIALRMKGESLGEMLGFYQALAERVHQLRAPEFESRVVVLGTYDGTRTTRNLTPLVALLLQRMGVPVLVHGALDARGCVASAYVFRELGILPCATLAKAQACLDRERLAFVPTAVLAPGLASLLALRSRLGVDNAAHFLAMLIDPFAGRSLRLVGASHPGDLARVREIFLATGERALVLRGTEGEPFADPCRRPCIEYVDGGRVEILFTEHHPARRAMVGTPEMPETKSTACYIRKALSGGAPLPVPIVNEIACCLYGAGVTADLNQAKAVAAVQAHSLVTV